MESTVGVSGESKTLSSESRGAMIPDASQTFIQFSGAFGVKSLRRHRTTPV
jgi:hypothetical protein